MTLKFQAPPKTKYVRPLGPETQAVMDQLQANPGEWALIKENVNVSVSTWWKRRPGIEAKASTIGKPKSKCDVYARWVGGKA